MTSSLSLLPDVLALNAESGVSFQTAEIDGDELFVTLFPGTVLRCVRTHGVSTFAALEVLDAANVNTTERVQGVMQSQAWMSDEIDHHRARRQPPFHPLAKYLRKWP